MTAAADSTTTVRPRRGVFTIAVGAAKYLDMAKALGRSLALNSPDVPRGIATDSDDPELAALFPHRSTLPPGLPAIPRSLEAKLHLDGLAPFDEALFIDSDCLVLRPLDDLFDRLQDRAVATFGKLLDRADEWYADSAALRQRFGLNKLVGFNGGMYYVRRSPEATAIYDTARQLSRQYDELGVQRIGRGINEEPLMGLAMAIHGAVPFPNRDEPIMRVVRQPIDIDVLQGRGRIPKDRGVIEPRVLHFCNRRGQYYYFRERYRMQAAAGRRTLGLADELAAKIAGAWGLSQYRFGNLRKKFRR